MTVYYHKLNQVLTATPAVFPDVVTLLEQINTIFFQFETINLKNTFSLDLLVNATRNSNALRVSLLRALTTLQLSSVVYWELVCFSTLQNVKQAHYYRDDIKLIGSGEQKVVKYTRYLLRYIHAKEEG